MDNTLLRSQCHKEYPPPAKGCHSGKNTAHSTSLDPLFSNSIQMARLSQNGHAVPKNELDQRIKAHLATEVSGGMTSVIIYLSRN